MSYLRTMALWYAEKRGWHVFPLVPNRFEPLTTHGFKDASNDPEIVKAWWDKWPDANIGLALAPSGLMAADVDPRHEGHKTWAERYSHIDSTLKAKSAGDGIHYIFKVPEGTEVKGSFGPGVDAKWRGYVILAPSVRKGVQGKPDGKYEWISAGNAAPSPMPEEFRLVKAERPERGERTGDVADAALIREALGYLVAEDEFRDRNWFAIMGALHHWESSTPDADEAGWELFEEWCLRDPKGSYDDEVRARWEKMDAHREEGVTIATLFHRARLAGWAARSRMTVEQAARIFGAQVVEWTDAPQNGMPAIAPQEQLSKLLADNPEFSEIWSGSFEDSIARVATATAGNCESTLAILSNHPAFPGRTAELEDKIRIACAPFVALDPLQLPLDNPLAVFHPRQIEYRKNKDTGEFEFKGAVGTAENLERLCKAYGIRFRYNELAHAIELFVEGEVLGGDLAKNIQISMVENLARINNYPAPQVMSNIDEVAFKNAYNPAADWVRSAPWDGVSRIDDLMATLTLHPDQDKAFAAVLFRKWLLGATAILTGKAEKFEFVLTLVDPMGGLGKTRWANRLCPKAWMADGVTLDTRDKDSVLQVTSKWIVELGELDATFKRSDISALKAFLSRALDEVRPAYARASNLYSRRTAFMASVNRVKFLVDDTNNRRFWPIQVTSVDYEHAVDMQQVWAEALAAVEAGETWYLTAEQNVQIGDSNETFRAVDPIEELLDRAYDPELDCTRELTATEVGQEIGLGVPSQTQAMKIGSHLTKMGVSSRKVRGKTRYKLPVIIARTGP